MSLFRMVTLTRARGSGDTRMTRMGRLSYNSGARFVDAGFIALDRQDGVTVTVSFFRTRLIGLLTALLLGTTVLPWTMAASRPDEYPAFRTASGFSRGFQRVTGFTPVTGWVANRMLRKELSKHVDGQLTSRIQLFSGSDLLSGKALHSDSGGEFDAGGLYPGQSLPL